MSGRWDGWKAQGSHGTLGLEIVLSIVFGGWLGRTIGLRLGSEDTGMVVGGCFGLAAAVRAVMRAVSQMKREADEEERREGNPLPQYETPDEKSEPR